MKKIVYAFALMISINAFSQKQHIKKSTEQRADTISQRMKKTLELSEDQMNIAKEINLKVALSLKEVNLKYKEMMKADLKRIETSTDSQYRLLLTTDQFKKYLAFKERRMHRLKGKMK